MPPKKRIVKSTPTRRTPRSTSNSEASSAPPSPASAAAVEDDTSVSAPQSSPLPATVLPDAPEISSAPSEVPSSEPDVPPTAIEAEPVAKSEEAVLATASVDVDPQPAEEAPAVAKASGKVRKVVKKVIVKKVPKKAISPAAAVSEPVKEENISLIEGVETETQLSEHQPKPETEMDTESEPLEQEKEAIIDDNKADEKEVVKVVNTEVSKEVDVDQVKEEQKDDPISIEERGILERRWRRKTEIFIGGIHRDAQEEDIRKVFGKVGDIVEVRIIMEPGTGKNRGFGFLRYSHPLMAKKAVKKFEKVEVCGKLCGAASLEGNDTIYLGNIDKNWKKEDVVKVLDGAGIDNIDTVTVMTDPQNSNLNRGYAFLELETNKDAEIAFKKLRKVDAFVKDKISAVYWASLSNDPNEEDLQQVKSVYAEGIPSSWDEEKLLDTFKRFGEIEGVFLSRNMGFARRKEFSFINFTSRESALLCIELFPQEELIDNGSKVNVKVALAMPIVKNQQSLGALKSGNMDKPNEKSKSSQYTKVTYHSNKGNSSASSVQIKHFSGSFPLNVSSEQSTRMHGEIGFARGTAVQNYAYGIQGGKRTFSTMGSDAYYSDVRGYPRPRMDISYPILGSSYDRYGMSGSSLPHYLRPGTGYKSGESYGNVNHHSSSYAQTRGRRLYGSQDYRRY